MKRKRFSEEQIIRILHEAETLDNVRDVCRQHNIAEQTLYRWRRQFGGLDVSEAKRLRLLERENAALKRLVGELTLDNRMLKDVLGKNW
jgi:putative transposase